MRFCQFEKLPGNWNQYYRVTSIKKNNILQPTNEDFSINVIGILSRLKYKQKK